MCIRRISWGPGRVRSASRQRGGAGALSYRASIDTRDATWSDDDPDYCYNSGSVWFTVTPTEDGFLDLNPDDSGYYASVSVYTGLRGLLNPVFGSCSTGQTVVEVDAGTTYHVMAARCCDYGGNGGGLLDLAVSLRTGPANDHFADAGRTYYFQSGGLFGGGSPLTFTVDRSVQSVASYNASLQDPSRFDTVQFYNYSIDPADAGFASVEWDFGDGTTSTEDDPRHRYAADGDYPLRLTVTTTDGRTATATGTFRVRTHDVEIVSFDVPATASRPEPAGHRRHPQHPVPRGGDGRAVQERAR